MRPDEKRHRQDQMLAQWRESKSFSFPLNDDGKVARLEDARNLGRILSAKLLGLFEVEPIVALLMMIDEDETAFLFQLATVTHMMCCTDEKCGILNEKE